MPGRPGGTRAPPAKIPLGDRSPDTPPRPTGRRGGVGGQDARLQGDLRGDEGGRAQPRKGPTDSPPWTYGTQQGYSGVRLPLN